MQSSARYWPEKALYEVWEVCGGGSPHPRPRTFAEATYISSIGLADLLLASSPCITFLWQDVIQSGYRIKFSSRKQLDRQKKKEKRQSPAISDHLSKKQMTGVKPGVKNDLG